MVNHRELFLAGLLISTPLTADQIINHRVGSFFTPGELESIYQKIKAGEDLIVLADGTILKGKIPELPKIPFRVGKLPININDVLAIAFSNESQKDKMQIITRDGYTYVVELPEEKLHLLQPGNPQKEIDPRSISYILFGQRESKITQRPTNLHTLHLSNGDQVPIVIAEDAIRLSNGWEEITLKPGQIVDVKFDGGLYGTILKQGSECDLDFSFVKDPYLHIQIVKSPQVIGIPWNHLVAIRKEDPNGFKESLRYLSQKKDPAKSEIAFNNEKPRIIQPAEPLKSTTEDLQKQVVDAVRQRMLLEQELQQMRKQNGDLTRKNQSLAQHLEQLEVSEKDLRQKELLLTAQIELEMTRAQVLKKSLNDVYTKWQDSKQTGIDPDAHRQVRKELEELRNLRTREEAAAHAIREEIHSEFLGKIQKLSQQNEEALAHNAALEFQLRNLQDSLEASKDSATNLRHQIEAEASEKRQYELYQAKAAQLEILLGEEKERADILKNDLASALQQNDKYEESARAFQERFKESEESIVILETQLAEKNREIDNLTTVVQEFTEKLTYAEHALAQLADGLEFQQLRADAKEKEISLLGERLETERKEWETTLERQDLAHKDYFEAENTKIQALLEKEKSKIEELEYQLADVRHELTERQEKAIQIQQQLEKELEEQRTIVSQKNEDLLNLGQTLTDQKEFFQSKSDALAQQLDQKGLDLGNQQHQIHELKETIATLEKTRDGHQAEAAKLAKELETIGEHLAEAEKSALQEKEHLTEANNILQIRIAEEEAAYTQLHQEFQTLKQQLEEKDHDLYRLGESLTSQKEGYAQRLQKLNEELEKKQQENLALQHQLMAYSVQTNSLETTLTEEEYALASTKIVLQGKLQSLQNQYDFFEQEIKRLSAQASSEKSRADINEQELAVKEENIHHLKESLSYLEQQFHDVLAKASHLETEISGYKGALETKDREISQLGEALSSNTNSLAGKVDRLSAEYSTIDTERKALISQLDTSRNEWNKEREKLQTLTRDLGDRIVELQTELDHTVSTLNTKDHELFGIGETLAAQKASLNTKIQSLSDELERNRKEYANLKEEHGRVSNALHTAETSLQEIASSKDQELYGIGETLAAQKATLNNKIQSLNDELERNRKEYSSLKADHQTISEALEHAQEALSAKDHELFSIGETLAAQKASYNSKIQSLSDELERNRKEYTALKEDHQKISKALETSEAQHRDVVNSNHHVGETLANQKGHLQSLNNELEKNREEYAALKEDYDHLQEILNAKDHELFSIGETLAAQKAAQTSKIQSLNDELERNRKEYAALKEDHQKISKALETSEAQHRDVVNSNHHVGETLANQKGHLQSLNNELEKNREEYAALKEDYDHLQEILNAKDHELFSIGETLAAQKAAQTSKIQSLNDELEKNKKEYRNLKEDHQRVSYDLTTALREKEGAVDKLLQIEAELAQNHSESERWAKEGEKVEQQGHLTSLTEKVKAYEDKIRQLAHELEAKDEDMYALGDRLSSQKNHIEALSVELTSKEEERKSLLRQLNEGEAKVVHLQKDQARLIDELGRQMKRAQEEQEALASEKRRIEQEAFSKRASEANEEIERISREKEADIGKLKQAFELQKEAFANKLKGIGAELDRKDQEKRYLEEQLHHYSKEAESAGNDQKRLYQQLQTLENDHSAADRQIRELASANEGLQRKLAAIENDASHIEVAYKTNEEERQNLVYSLEENKEVFDQQCARYEKEIARLTRQLSEKDQSEAKLTALQNDLNLKIRQAYEQAEQYKKETASAYKQLASAEEEIRRIKYHQDPIQKKEASYPITVPKASQTLREMPSAPPQKSQVFKEKKGSKFYTEGGARIAMEGYDPLNYFNGSKPKVGLPSHEYEWEGVKWRFSNKENLNAFKENPSRYSVQFGGYCPWSLAHGDQSGGLPHIWTVQEGKLYLFSSYDALQKWSESNVATKKKAESAWQKIESGV